MGCDWRSTVSEVRQPHVVVIEQVISGVVERVVHDDLDCLVVLSHPMQRGCCNGLGPHQNGHRILVVVDHQGRGKGAVTLGLLFHYVSVVVRVGEVVALLAV